MDDLASPVAAFVRDCCVSERLASATAAAIQVSRLIFASPEFQFA